MSTIKTETLSTPSNATVPVDTVVNGTAKAWVNFNGTGTVAIRRAFNVSSITDNGTGAYTVNFTTAMPDTNYAITCYNRSDGTATNYSYVLTSNSTDTKTTSALGVSTRYTSSGGGSGVYDSSETGVAIFS